MMLLKKKKKVYKIIWLIYAYRCTLLDLFLNNIFYRAKKRVDSSSEEDVVSLKLRYAYSNILWILLCVLNFQICFVTCYVLPV